MDYRFGSSVNIEDILADQREGDGLLEVPLEDRTFSSLLLVGFVMAFVVIAQLLLLYGSEGDVYKAQAISNMTKVRIEPAPRGVIVDRFGKPLVKNDPSFNAFIVPGDLPKGSEKRWQIIRQVSTVLGIPESDLVSKLQARDWRVSGRILVKEDLSHDELVSMKGSVLSGVEVEPGFKRVHQVPLKFSHLVGYTGLVEMSELKKDKNLRIDDEIGRLGLEAFYDNELRGVPGKEYLVRDAQGNLKEKQAVEKPQEGKTLETFIDRDLQTFMYDSLDKALTSLDRRVGMAMAMNPQNGEVLALASIPGFETGKIAETLSKPNNPLWNRMVSGLYNPGSTIKPLVATAALTTGVVKPEKTIYSPGYLEVPNPFDPSKPSRFLDWQPQGWVDVKSALAKSSNVYFYSVGGGTKDQIGLGIVRLKDWWQKFNLDKQTGIDLPGEASGFLPDPGWKEKKKGSPWRLGDTYNVSIGQGDLLITPIELLNYVSAIANGGKFYAPRIAKKQSPVLVKDISGEIGSALREVRKGMEDVVQKSYGTAHMLESLPMKIAGKTGSAQTDNNKKTNAFFVGYAPVEKPEIAILLLVEDAREGSLNVVPIAKDVFEWYYEKRVKRDEPSLRGLQRGESAL